MSALLEITGLSKQYPFGQGLFGRGGVIRAVDAWWAGAFA